MKIVEMVVIFLMIVGVSSASDGGVLREISVSSSVSKDRSEYIRSHSSLYC